MTGQSKSPDKEMLIHIDKLFNNSIVAHNEIIAQVSMFLIRWLVIINGSASIALLALIGNTWGKVTKEGFVAALLPSIAIFASACVAALLVAGGLYFNFFYITRHLGLRQKQILLQIQGKDSVVFVSKIKWCGIKVIVLQWLAIIFVIVSIVLFVLGGTKLYCNLNLMLGS